MAAEVKLKDRYDVVIVGGGSHGLTTAYYLAKNHGITDVAILEKSYIGSGAAGRHDDHPRQLPHARGAEFYRRASSSTKASAPTSTSTSSSRSRATWRRHSTAGSSPRTSAPRSTSSSASTRA